MQNSSSSSKTIGIVIVVLIVAGGIWLMTRKSDTDYSSNTAATGASQQTANATGAGTSTNTPAGSTGSSTSTITSTDNSDAALNQDAASIDTQMSGLNSDSSAAQSTQ